MEYSFATNVVFSTNKKLTGLKTNLLKKMTIKG